MKLARVNQGYIGLVFRNGDYRKFIEAGLNVLYFNEEVQLYNMSLVFNAPVLLEILMKDAALMEKLQIVEVNDSQLGILYKNGFKTWSLYVLERFGDLSSRFIEPSRN